MSVYRTIGPLVHCFIKKNEQVLCCVEKILIYKYGFDTFIILIFSDFSSKGVGLLNESKIMS